MVKQRHIVSYTARSIDVVGGNIIKKSADRPVLLLIDEEPASWLAAKAEAVSHALRYGKAELGVEHILSVHSFTPVPAGLEFTKGQTIALGGR